MKRNYYKYIICIILCLSIISLFSSCTQKSEKSKQVRYKKDTLQQLSYKYPSNYTRDYCDDDQASYLLDKNKGIIFLIIWDTDKEDISDRGELKEINGIKGYYWIDYDSKDPNDYDYAYSFILKDNDNNLKDYRIYASDEEVFWNIINSLEIIK